MWTVEGWSLEYMIFVEIIKTILYLWFHPILSIFEFLKRFYMLSINWLVKSYNFTSQLVILTTLYWSINLIEEWWPNLVVD